MAVVEDYEPLLKQLKSEINLAPGLECVGTFQSCEELIESMPATKPDMVLLDIGLPRMSGITCIKEIKRQWPRTKCLVLSDDVRRQSIIDAISEGADGYLEKGTPRQKLAAAILRVHEGGWATSDRVTGELVHYIQTRRPMLAKLSTREREILDWFGKGGSLKEIADRLGSSVETVKTHARRICDKTGVNTLRASAYVRKGSAF